MNFRQALEPYGGGINTVADAMAALRIEHGNHAARWISTNLNIPLRSARYALAGRAIRDSARRQAILDAGRESSGATALKRHRIAERLRKAKRVDVGRVEVYYQDRYEGERDIGVLKAGGILRNGLDETADLIEAGNWDEAAEVFGAAVLNAYGGLGDTLHITDYQNGIRLS